MKWMKISMLAASTALIPAAVVAGGHSGGSYCENAFFAGDQNADGVISDAEAEAMRNAVFEQLDANADGSIDREEYVACTSKSAEKTAMMGAGMEASAEDMAAMDANADGAIDPQEFFDSARTAYEDALAGNVDDLTWAEKYVYLGDDVSVTDDSDNPFSFTTEEYFAQVGAKYKGVDADGDRMITAEEWSNQGQPISEARMMEIWDRYDINGDGGVDGGEFQEVMAINLVNAAEDAARDGFTDPSKGIPVQSWYQEAM